MPESPFGINIARNLYKLGIKYIDFGLDINLVYSVCKKGIIPRVASFFKWQGYIPEQPPAFPKSYESIIFAIYSISGGAIVGYNGYYGVFEVYENILGLGYNSLKRSIFSAPSRT